MASETLAVLFARGQRAVMQTWRLLGEARAAVRAAREALDGDAPDDDVSGNEHP